MLLHLLEIHVFCVLLVKEGLFELGRVGLGFLRLLRTLLRLALLRLLLSATHSAAKHEQKPDAGTESRQYDDRYHEQQCLH